MVVATAASERERAGARTLAVHALVFAAVLALVEVPRVGLLRQAAGVAALSLDRGYEDFDNAYHPAGRIVREEPEKLYEWKSYGRRGEPGTDITTAGYFVNIPIVAWLFAPFSLLSLRAAGDLFFALNVGVSIASLVLLQQRISPCAPSLRWLVTGAFATSGPLLNALHLGQTTPAVLLALVLAERHLRRGGELAAGAWLAVICILKIPPLALLAYFAWRRRWRLVAGAGAVMTATVLASLALYGWRLHAGYLDAAFADYVGAALPSHDCQSIGSVLARLTTDAPLWSWKPVTLAPGARLAQSTLAGVVLAAVSLALFRARRQVSHASILLGSSLVLCATLVVLPVYWTHYGTWLVPVAVVAAGAGSRRPTAGVLAVVAAALLLINFPVPPRSIIESANDERWFRLLISHQAIGTLVLLGVCAWRLERLDSRTEVAAEKVHAQALRASAP